MTDHTRDQIDSLDELTVGQLRDRYAEVYGEGTRSSNRRWMIRRIAWRLQAQVEGDLTERARVRAAELARDADLRVRPPSDWESSGVALGAAVRTVTGTVARRPDERLPIAGSVLTREFKGIEHRVTVLSNGFEHEGTAYRSLSAVAHAITGSHWNGYLFFGLTKPKRGGSA
ncbi:MAG: hypothetical protein ACI89L_002466 [Phycisphaerales bacterium]|jgi:hypothetical protein